MTPIFYITSIIVYCIVVNMLDAIRDYHIIKNNNKYWHWFRTAQLAFQLNALLMFACFIFPKHEGAILVSGNILFASIRWCLFDLTLNKLRTLDTYYKSEYPYLLRIVVLIVSIGLLLTIFTPESNSLISSLMQLFE